MAWMDPLTANLLDLLVELCGQEKLTLVVSMHQLELAKEFFPRLVGLRDGRVLFDRNREDLRQEDVDELYRLEDRAG